MATTSISSVDPGASSYTLQPSCKPLCLDFFPSKPRWPMVSQTCQVAPEYPPIHYILEDSCR